MRLSLYFNPGININDSKIFITELIKKFVNDMEFCSEHSRNTVKTYKFAVRTISKKLNRMEPINTINILNATPDQIKQAFYMETSLSNRTRNIYCVAVKHFYDYLHKNKIIEDNPSSLITIKNKKSQQLPNFLSEKEINAVLEMANVDNTPIGIRNRAIVHLLYATGIRNSELREITLRAIDWDSGCIKILGKGDKGRFVVFQEETKKHLLNYIENSRPVFALTHPQNPYLFLTKAHIYSGKINKNPMSPMSPMSSQSLCSVIKKLSIAVNNPDISPHWFRHSYATHMVNNGANLRAVQELMGHSELGTTAIYLHVTVNQLKEEHKKFHPRSSRV